MIKTLCPSYSRMFYPWLCGLVVFLCSCSTDLYSEQVGSALLDELAPNAPAVNNDDMEAQAWINVALISEVRSLAKEHGLTALPAPPEVRPELVELGQMLMFDRELSGNRDVSCMTCHHPNFSSADGRHLPIGQGASTSRLGPVRRHPTRRMIQRNALPLFNLHAMHTLLWDGRVQQLTEDATMCHLDRCESLPGGHIATPALSQVTPEMQAVFEFGPVSSLGLFPVTDRGEMRADTGNELAAVADEDFQGIWSALMTRLGKIDTYRDMFEAAYPGTPFDAMTFAHASNAIGGFIVSEFSATDTRWDQFLRGRYFAMSNSQLEGAKLFMTKGCVQCHNGATLSDQEFHNTALAQFGPGKGNGESGRDDFGRMNISGNAADQYRFRTAPLRNVELTAPYGHLGQFNTLDDFIRHYNNADEQLEQFTMHHIADHDLHGMVVENTATVMASRDPLLDDIRLSEYEVQRLKAFLLSLTDRQSKYHLHDVMPRHVPSGLAVERR